MNINKKIIIAGAMVAMFSVCQPIPIGTENFNSMNKAEAFSLGNLGKDIGEKALGLEDVDQLQDKNQSMILNLSRAAICYAQAAIDISTALNMNPEQRAQMQAALNGLMNNKTDLGSMKQVGESTKMDQKELENAAQNLMDSGDQERINQANELIKKSKVERQAANLYKGLALRDATKIATTAAAAMSSGNLSEKADTLNNLLDTAKNAQAIGDIIGGNHKVMKDALKSYEKKNNIKDVSDKDAEKQMKDFGLE